MIRAAAEFAGDAPSINFYESEIAVALLLLCKHAPDTAAAPREQIAHSVPGCGRPAVRNARLSRPCGPHLR